MTPEELPLEPIDLSVDEPHAGRRLDAFLAEQFPLYSRVQIRRVINAAGVTVDGTRTKASYRLQTGQKITIFLPDISQEGPTPENIPLDILYEDEYLVAINKPPRMVVHPAKGHWSGTLTSALAFHFRQLSSAGGPTRPGIVHRLDRDTSGVIVVAKTDRVHLALAKQFETRTTEKEYFTIVAGTLDRDRDVVRQPIGIHPYQREKMAVRAEHSTSRDAYTFFEVIERFKGFTSIKVLPKTGRTHQIRVHLAHLGTPVLCDRLYGSRAEVTRGELHNNRDDKTIILDRLALHARRLKLRHPETEELIEFQAELPDDIVTILNELRTSRSLDK